MPVSLCSRASSDTGTPSRVTPVTTCSLLSGAGSPARAQGVALLPARHWCTVESCAMHSQRHIVPVPSSRTLPPRVAVAPGAQLPRALPHNPCATAPGAPSSIRASARTRDPDKAGRGVGRAPPQGLHVRETVRQGNNVANG